MFVDDIRVVIAETFEQPRRSFDVAEQQRQDAGRKGHGPATTFVCAPCRTEGNDGIGNLSQPGLVLVR